MVHISFPVQIFLSDVKVSGQFSSTRNFGDIFVSFLRRKTTFFPIIIDGCEQV